MKHALLVAGLVAAFGFGTAQAYQLSVTPTFTGSTMSVDSAVAGATGRSLVVAGPQGYRVESTGAGNGPIVLDLGALADGNYKWELRVTTDVGGSTAQQGKQHTDDSQGVASGSFEVSGGAIALAGEAEDQPDASNGTGIGPLTFWAGDGEFGGSVCAGCSSADVDLGSGEVLVKSGVPYLTVRDTTDDIYWRLTTGAASDALKLRGTVTSTAAMTTPVTVEAGTPNNTLYLDSTGTIGIGTSTPETNWPSGIDIASSTPGVTLTSTSAGGHKWGLENWGFGIAFHDITAGAAANPLQISNSGQVGIGIDGIYAIGADLDILAPANGLIRLGNVDTNATNKLARMVVRHYNNAEEPVYLFGAASLSGANYVAFGGGGGAIGNAATQLDFYTAANATTTSGTARMTITSNGSIGMGTQTPAYPLHMASGARCTTGGVWTNNSSREAKENITAVGAEEALLALNTLTPVKYNYKSETDEQYVGFIAEDVPEIVAMKDHKSLASMDIVGVLTRVIQEQQKTIADLSDRMAQLEKAQSRP